MKAITLISLSFMAIACGDGGSHPSSKPVITDEVDMMGIITDKEVMKAPCLASNNVFETKLWPSFLIPSETVLKEYWDSFVAGIDKNTFPRSGAERNCTDSLCKIRYIFPTEDIANRAIYLRHRYGYNISEYQSNAAAFAKIYGSYTTQFTKEELDVLIQGLESMPADFIGQEKYTGGRFMLRIPYLGYNVAANSAMAYADSWASASRAQKLVVMIHELGHVLEYDVTLMKAWRDLSGWPAAYSDRRSEFSRTYYSSDITYPERMVSQYSRKSPAEDFAESVSFYRFAPDKMKKASPEKYQWIKYHVFQGLEYTSETACKATSTCAAATTKTFNSSQAITDESECGDKVILEAIGKIDASIENSITSCLREQHFKDQMKTAYLTTDWNADLYTASASVCSNNRDRSIEDFKFTSYYEVNRFRTHFKNEWKNSFDTACSEQISLEETRVKNQDPLIQKDGNCAINGISSAMQVSSDKVIGDRQRAALQSYKEILDLHCQNICLEKHPTWKKSPRT